MQSSHYHHSKLQSIPSPSFKSPHRTHLFLNSLFYYEFVLPNDKLQSLTIRKKLRISSGIKSLTIGYFKNDYLNIRQGVSRKSFINLLKEFRNIKSLKITCVPFSDFQVLRKVFRSFRALKSLDITFAGMNSQHNRNLSQDFIKTFSPRLHKLKLNLTDSLLRRQYESYRSCFRNCQIHRLNNLQELALHFPFSSFIKEEKNPKGNLAYIDLSPMKGLNKLKNLEIALAHWYGEEFIKVNTKDLYFDPNELFPNLKKFTWSVRRESVLKIKELELIGPQIASKLKDLDDFGLAFRQSPIQTEIKDFIQCLATLQTKLNFLHFVYNFREFSKQDAKALISALSLQRLKSLHTLSLEFKRCKGITNGFLAGLAQTCVENFAGLRYLNLSFEALKFDDTFIPTLMKALFRIEGISDQGIKSFARILSTGCQDLEFVSLKFEKYFQISDRGVKSLCRKLNRKETLKTVRIQFNNCWRVTEKGCEKAAKLLGTNRQVLVNEWRASLGELYKIKK